MEVFNLLYYNDDTTSPEDTEYLEDELDFNKLVTQIALKNPTLRKITILPECGDCGMMTWDIVGDNLPIARAPAPESE